MNEQEIIIDTSEVKESNNLSIKKDLSEELISEPRPVSTNKKSSGFANCCSAIFPCIKSRYNFKTYGIF